MRTPRRPSRRSASTARRRPARRRAYRTQQQPAPTRAPTRKARLRSRSDNASVDQAVIPSDNPAVNRPQPLLRPPANLQVTTLVRSWSGGRHPFYAPDHALQQEEQGKWVGGTGAGLRARGSGRTRFGLCVGGAAAPCRRQVGYVGGERSRQARCQRPEASRATSTPTSTTSSDSTSVTFSVSRRRTTSPSMDDRAAPGRVARRRCCSPPGRGWWCGRVVTDLFGLASGCDGG